MDYPYSLSVVLLRLSSMIIDTNTVLTFSEASYLLHLHCILLSKPQLCLSWTHTLEAKCGWRNDCADFTCVRTNLSPSILAHPICEFFCLLFKMPLHTSLSKGHIPPLCGGLHFLFPRGKWSNWMKSSHLRIRR